MSYRINLTDYNSDWALRNSYVDPREIDGYLSREDVVSSYALLGIDGVELMHAYWEDCSPAYVKKIWADAGLPVFSYIFFVDLAVPPHERQQAIDTAFGLIDRTYELGASHGMIIPAELKPHISLQEQRSWLIEGLRRIAEYGDDVGVTLISENCEYPPIRLLMGRGSDCCSICREVDSPGFRLIYDACCSVFVEEDPIQTLYDMEPYITHVHLKNYRPIASDENVLRYRTSGAGQRYAGCLLNEGVANIPEILAELKHLDYTGDVLLEYQGEVDPREALPANLEYLRHLMDSE